MGNGAGVAGNFTEHEKAHVIDMILRGEGEDLADKFGQMFEELKKSNVPLEESKSRFQTLLAAKRESIVNRIEERIKEEPVVKSVRRTSNLDGLEFPEVVAKSNERLATKGAHSFLVCVDGSSTSEVAFNLSLSLRRKIDSIVLLHAYRTDIDQETLPPPYRVHEIRSKFETLLIGNVPTTNFNMCFLERGEGQTAKDILTNVIDKCRKGSAVAAPVVGPHIPDWVIIGFSGRKSEIENRKFIGSSTDLALRSVHMPIIIAKRPITSESRSFVFAVDCTTVSKLGLDILLTLVLPKDDLTIIHIQDTSGDHNVISLFEKTKKYYEDELRATGPPNSRFISIPQVAGRTVGDVLIDHVNNELSPDFLVIAPRAQPHITSIAELLILRATSNVILCKA